MSYPSDLVRTKDWGSEVLTDSDLEGQLDLINNWIMAFANPSTGHGHGGANNSGPKINLATSVTGSLPDSNLAQITTASKVSGAAITLLSSVPAGAGVLPLANRAGAIKVGTLTRAMDAASGDVGYTGVGFTPQAILIFGGVVNSSGDGRSSWSGFDNGTIHSCMYGGTAMPNMAINQSYCVFLQEGAGKTQTAIVKTFDADGFTLTWTRTGATASATANLYYIAIG